MPATSSQLAPIANEKLPRSQLNLDYDVVLKLLGELTTEVTGLPLLRIYWYDGTATGPTPQQLALAMVIPWCCEVPVSLVGAHALM
jgi:hypothetical protein